MKPVLSLFLSSFCLLSLGEGTTLRKRDLGVTNICRRLHLEILISPLVGRSELRRLEVQWEHAPNKQADWIGLFQMDLLAPSKENGPPPVIDRVPVTSVHGWAKTNIFENHTSPELLEFQGKCLNYYAAYFDENNNTLAVTCLRTEPTWMWNLRKEIGPRSMKTIFVPGTHDSAAYGEYNPFIGDTLIKKYSITQDETILAQLIYGVRYLDLRVGYYKLNNIKWWANHGVLKIHPLDIIFRDIKTFLNHTNEIVILDVQEFPVGFDSSQIHHDLVSLLQDEFKDVAVPAALGWDATLDQIWSTGKRLIIGYDDRETVQQYPHFLWQPVQHKWGNVRMLDKLYTYLAGVIERPPSNVWSAMAQLTPTALDLLLDRLKGLRVMAESVNHNVTDWFRRNDWRPQTNVVAVDFFRNTGIIRSAIEWNKSQGNCPQNPKTNF